MVYIFLSLSIVYAVAFLTQVLAYAAYGKKAKVEFEKVARIPRQMTRRKTDLIQLRRMQNDQPDRMNMSF